ncbi:uncharacterized protein LOC135691085 [Rhopilema esculentum]|uniref:uncharacterized protein LOC135691085 n=1 Tax=Rhopilema esculentum TaxID=499914 RepID=UPI0031D6B6AA|eukprot:gene1710-16190_t
MDTAINTNDVRDESGEILKRFPLIMAKEESKVSCLASPTLPPLIPINSFTSKSPLETDKKNISPGAANFSISSILSSDSNRSLVLESAKRTIVQNEATGEKQRPSSRRSHDRGVPSYTCMIGQAILSSPTQQITLGEIYDYIEKKFPSIEVKVKGWRNCVRHNLSLNECFVKVGPSRHGRGNNWTVHPSYIESFLRGQFRKRMSTRRRRGHVFGPPYWADQKLNGMRLNAGDLFPTIYPSQRIDTYGDFHHSLDTDRHTERCLVSRRPYRFEDQRTENTLPSRCMPGSIHYRNPFHHFCNQFKAPVSSPTDIRSENANKGLFIPGKRLGFVHENNFEHYKNENFQDRSNSEDKKVSRNSGSTAVNCHQHYDGGLILHFPDKISTLDQSVTETRPLKVHYEGLNLARSHGNFIPPSRDSKIDTLAKACSKVTEPLSKFILTNA